MIEAPATALERAYAHCELLLRENDKDRFLADLFIPAARRRHIHALHAFSLEIARIRELVSEPMPGEIRHQWWRDAIEGDARGGVSANPVAAALIDTIVRFNLSRRSLVALIDARGFDLYDSPMADLPSLEAYCKNTSSVLFSMAGEILADASETLDAPSPVARDDTAAVIGSAPLIAAAAEPAGLAYAFTGLIRAFPLHAARGQVFLPSEVLRRHGSSLEEALSGRATPARLASLAEWRREARRHLEKAQAAVTHLPESLKPAFLPLALVKPYLDANEKCERDPFRPAAELPQWRRQWALWRGLPKSAPAR
ncbi:MAG: phytoene/squalene synthase family protein [Beijerinckiaceae bacterium]